MQTNSNRIVRHYQHVSAADEEWLADLMDSANLSDLYERRLAARKQRKMRYEDIYGPALGDLLDIDDTPTWQSNGSVWA